LKQDFANHIVKGKTRHASDSASRKRCKDVWSLWDGDKISLQYTSLCVWPASEAFRALQTLITGSPDDRRGWKNEAMPNSRRYGAITWPHVETEHKVKYTRH